MKTLKEEYQDLLEMKSMIENPIFQEMIAIPLREKRDKLKVNFFSDSLKDAWRKGGRQEGLNEFFNILKNIDIDFKNKRDEIEGLPK